jgi:hypothetical protein
MKFDELKEKWEKKCKKMKPGDWDLMYPGHDDYYLCKEIVDDLRACEFP